MSNLPWSFPGAFLAAGGVTIEPSSGWVGLAVALIALSAMEIVLGIDNIVFISIATNKLPEEQRKKARLTGLGLAMGFRILLLFFIATIASWVKPLFQLDQFLPSFLNTWLANSAEINEVSARDLILFLGGLFLVYQSVREIHHLTESPHESDSPSLGRKTVIRLHSRADRTTRYCLLTRLCHYCGRYG